MCHLNPPQDDISRPDPFMLYSLQNIATHRPYTCLHQIGHHLSRKGAPPSQSGKGPTYHRLNHTFPPDNVYTLLTTKQPINPSRPTSTKTTTQPHHPQLLRNTTKQKQKAKKTNLEPCANTDLAVNRVSRAKNPRERQTTTNNTQHKILTFNSM
jgi:hypothetical protein